jgi:hypothetical protein
MASKSGFPDRVAQHPVRVQIEVALVEPNALRKRLGQLDCRLLALEAGLAEGIRDRLHQLVDHFACDMLIVP